MTTLVLRLSGEAVNGRRLCGLGSQLARIVTLASAVLGEVVWYGADVEIVGNSSLASLISSPAPYPVGQSRQLVAFAESVDQFLRGVFLAVKVEKSHPQFRSYVDTEDPVDADLGDAILEVRAFDTTCFEMLTKDKGVADSLAQAFGVKVASG